MTTITNFYSAKPGTGCTATAIRYAQELPGNTLIVDWSASADITAVMGVRPLDDDSVMSVTDNISITNKNITDLRTIIDTFEDVVIDYGRIRSMKTVWEPEALSDTPVTARNVVILRNEYLCLYAYIRNNLSCDWAYIIDEPGRAIGVNDAERTIGRPTVRLECDPRVQRAIDAGLLTSRKVGRLQIPATL